MVTERETVNAIINKEPDGILGLFDRHGALFREGLLRFRGEAGIEQADLLAKAVNGVVEDLRAGAFDDLNETFYNWIVRRTWCHLMAFCREEEPGDHIAPDVIYDCADRVNEQALPEEVREQCRTHFAECERCRAYLENSKAIPLEARHAGALFPDDFRVVIGKALEQLK